MSSHDTHPDCPVGVCILPAPPPNSARTVAYPEYIHEILQRAGLCYRDVGLAELGTSLPKLSVLVTVGEARLPAGLEREISAWVENGGSWLAVAGTCGLTDLFGVETEFPSYRGWGANVGTLGEGYLSCSGAGHPAIRHIRRPLHFFNGIPTAAGDCEVLASVLDAHQRPTGRVGITIAKRGKGCCMLIAPDLTGSVIRIRQGIAVTRDGVSAPDGTASIGDGILKSGDGTVLDWLFDRRPVEGVPGLSAFLEPVADIWIEILLRAVIHLASQSNAVVALLWYYPRNLPALGCLSHDSDGNDPAAALRMLDIVNGCGIKSTWCVMAPGYPSNVVEHIREDGHELAMHYDAMGPEEPWAETSFDRQFRQLTELFGYPPLTNKNHFLRWEGDTGFFEWLERRGFRVDQSKGASKSGEAGFNFGTCHIYRPVAPDGRVVDVFEMPTVTQDLGVFAPVELLDPLLKAVTDRNGILHLLFHPVHMASADTESALRRAVEKARSAGLEWWTAARIAGWEDARRCASWVRITPESAVLRIVEPLPDACVIWPARGSCRPRVNGASAEPRLVRRWDMDFCSVQIDGAPGEYRIDFGVT